MKTWPSIEKSSFGWPSNPLAVPRPHNVHAAALAWATGSTGGSAAGVLPVALMTSVGAGVTQTLSVALGACGARRCRVSVHHAASVSELTVPASQRPVDAICYACRLTPAATLRGAVQIQCQPTHRCLRNGRLLHEALPDHCHRVRCQHPPQAYQHHL